MFPLRAARSCHRLSLVIGPTVSKYYAVIGLPPRPQSAFLLGWTFLPRFLAGERCGSPEFSRASLHACHAPRNRRSLRLPAAAQSSCWLPHPSRCRPSHDGLTRLSASAAVRTPLTACVIPCVRLHHIVRTLALLYSANTRYEWMANPFSTKTRTPEFPPTSSLR
jgi:hypothetical protein